MAIFQKSVLNKYLKNLDANPEIEQVASELYGLTPEEIKIVEASVQ